MEGDDEYEGCDLVWSPAMRFVARHGNSTGAMWGDSSVRNEKFACGIFRAWVESSPWIPRIPRSAGCSLVVMVDKVVIFDSAEMKLLLTQPVKLIPMPSHVLSMLRW